MTSRIFIRGNVGCLPVGCEIYDADTMQKLMVQELTMKAAAGHGTTARMVVVDTQMVKSTYDVYLVPDPHAAPRGTVLYQLEHLSTVKPSQSMREEQFSFFGFVSRDGVAVRDTTLDFRAVRDITDCSMTKDLDGEVRKALGELGQLVGATLMRKFGPEIPEKAVSMVVPQGYATCAECFGTGYQKGFGAPCSRGCAAP